MTRKTLAEKRLAQQRKKNRLLQQEPSPQQKIADKPKIIPSQSDKQLNEERPINFFRQDFKKSMLVILVIIALEIVFYFASMNKHLLKFLNPNF